jgi:predicted MPP superfamily phosphohydrolase
MNRMLSMIIFFGIVLGIYCLINWYVLGRFAFLLGFRRTLAFYVLVFVMTFSLVIAVSVESAFGNWLSRPIFVVGTMWLGIAFLSFWVLLVLQIASAILRPNPTAAAIFSIIIVLLTTVYACYNARRVYVNRIELHAPVNLRIAHISDIHIGSNTAGFLRYVVDCTNDLKPDVVLITGDLFDNHNQSTARAAAELNLLAAPVFMSSGNHEVYVGYENVARMLAATKVRWLRDETSEFGPVEIIGVNNHASADYLSSALARLMTHQKYTIVMYHQPLGIEAAVREHVDLVLCGHTHAGQLWPFNFVVGRIYEHLSGTHVLEGTVLNVSPGTGTWGPKMRLGSHNEITLIDLKKD